MNRRLVPLTADALERLPARCQQCGFWELGGPRPDPRGGSSAGGDELSADVLTQKAAWCASIALESGPPGRLACIDGRTVGYVLFGPAERFAPRRPPAPAVSDDALLVATLWVEPGYRDGGIGKLLVHAAIKQAQRLDRRAVEVYGDRRHHEAECVVPSQWLLHQGFVVHREHPRHPVLRLEVRRAVKWAQSLEAALDEVLERVPRSRGAVEPSPRSGVTGGPGGAGRGGAASRRPSVRPGEELQ